MPNEYAAQAIIRSSSKQHAFRRPPIHPALLSIPGAEALPTYQGRTLYLPLYRKGLGRYFGPNSRSRPNGLGYVDIGGLLSVGSSAISAADGFFATFAAIASTVGQVVVAIIQNIVEFIVDAVVAVVSAVLKGVSGLLGAVLDAVGLKGDGKLDPSKAGQLAALLGAKSSSLTGADGKLERPMTAEEKAAYERNLAAANSGIAGLAGGIVSAFGGTTNTILVGGAAAAIIMFGGKR